MKVFIAASACLLLVALLAFNRSSDTPSNITVSWYEDSIAYRFHTTRASLEYLVQEYGRGYDRGPSYLDQLSLLEQRYQASKDAGKPWMTGNIAHDLIELQREAIISSPVVDFENMLLVKRKVDLQNWEQLDLNHQTDRFGFPTNHECNTSLQRNSFENEIALLSGIRTGGTMKTLYAPPYRGYAGEVDLHWDAQRILFTQSDSVSWKVMEMDLATGDVSQVSRAPADVDCYDAAYLPNGKIVFGSSANYQSVPCWHGLKRVTNLYLMNADGSGMRRICYDEDHDLHPVVISNGQVLFNRWDYTGTSHPFLRQQMVMNPDGTAQRCIYGSNSWFPNALYFSRELPGKPGRLVSILSGYHGTRRMGQLVVVDTKKGWFEEEGLTVRISGQGDTITPKYYDKLVCPDWPKFTTPYPLNDKYFLVSCWKEHTASVGIYLADVFDNLVLIKEIPGHALLEPIPLRTAPVPPVIPDRVRLDEKEATVYIHNVYAGPGLKGVPEGTIRRIRVFSYHFGYFGLAGPQKVGNTGPWEPMKIIGTVAVEEDGSAMFRVPANIPIAFQVLDKEGAAVQLMRSWVTAMPGEYLSCVGCHESPAEIAPATLALAAHKQPSTLEPWFGEPRGLDFERDVQPVLNKYCIECHNGENGSIPDLRPESAFPDYRGKQLPYLGYRRLHPRIRAYDDGYVRYTPAYDALLPYIRRVNIEDDVSIQLPGEYHAGTSPLIQMLRKSHHGVELNREAWERLYTWIDLNGPCHGTWKEIFSGQDEVLERELEPSGPYEGWFNTEWALMERRAVYDRRRELDRLYGGPEEDPERIPEHLIIDTSPYKRPAVNKPAALTLEGWPLAPQKAKEQQAAQDEYGKTVRIGSNSRVGDGLTLRLVKIPAGRFIMGYANGQGDEWPQRIIEIEKPFWMAAFEITNAQFSAFRPEYDSRYYTKRHIRFDDRGVPLNNPNQPAVRVSWDEAVAFCEWLSEQTGMHFNLPTEAQWEYACRAGSGSELFFGESGDDFSAWANLGDRAFCRDLVHPNLFVMREMDGLNLADTMWQDQHMVTAPAGSFRPNAWGLYDMHGNAAEWVRTAYAPYPYNESARGENKVVRGGSFYDPPRRARSSYRLYYPAWQKVFNVGFRVVAEVK